MFLRYRTERGMRPRQRSFNIQLIPQSAFLAEYLPHPFAAVSVIKRTQIAHERLKKQSRYKPSCIRNRC
jgi:hypothetical protein